MCHCSQASGVENCFYLVEGSVKNLRFVSADLQQRLKVGVVMTNCGDSGSHLIPSNLLLGSQALGHGSLCVIIPQQG